MKLLLLIALLVLVTLTCAQPEPDRVDPNLSDDYDEFNGGSDDYDDAGLDNNNYNDDDDDDDDEDDEDDDDDDDDDEDDEDDDKILPTTAYPTERRWPGFKCMLKARKCFMNASDCEEHLACYEEKSTCMQAAKKDQKPFMKKPSKMVCKTMFTKCMERAGSDCFKKYMCYRKKGFCYRSRGRSGHRRPCGHHFRPRHHHRRPHHHGRHPTMNPEMMKCKIQLRQCYMEANNCSEKLKCKFDFHHCLNHSIPTGPPPTMSPDEEDTNVYGRRWNPKLMAKCKREFKECIGNSSTCSSKMKCFDRMKMCFKHHHYRPHHGYKRKTMLIKISGRKPYFGGYFGNRGNGGRYGQRFGRQWGNTGRGMGRRIGQIGRKGGNRGFGRVERVFKPIQKKLKNWFDG